MPAITVTPEEVSAAGKTIQSQSQQVEDLIKSMMNTATSVQEAWTGQAATAFQSAMNDWKSAASTIQLASTQIGQATSMSGSNYADAESTNQSMFT